MTEKVQFVVTSEGWHDSFEDVSSVHLLLCLWCLISLAATQFDVKHKSKNTDLVLVGWKSLPGAGKNQTQPHSAFFSQAALITYHLSQMGISNKSNKANYILELKGKRSSAALFESA